MSAYQDLQDTLRADRRTWLVTGAAGFIGSHLCQRLLELGQDVVGLDSLATGHLANIEDVKRSVGPEAAGRLRFLEGDIRDPSVCAAACAGADHVLHQAALGSVPRSIEDPLSSHEANVTGFLNMLLAARDAQVRRFVYASSSSVYGDHPDLPKVEDQVGRPLSPYATTKATNELYARNFCDLYGLEVCGLRYFNVFGPRQDPAGAYAAVIPRWIETIRSGESCRINGDGGTSRDFCYIDNTVQANLLAATAEGEGVTGQAYNVACEVRTSLNELYAMIRKEVERISPGLETCDAEYGPERAGDVRHSLADVSKAHRLLGYEPQVDVGTGLARTVEWFLR